MFFPMHQLQGKRRMEQFFTNETNDFLLRSSRTQYALLFLKIGTVKTIFLVLVFQANIAIGFVWILAAFFAACPLLGWSNYVSEVRFIWLPLSYNFLKAHSHLSKNGVCTIHIYPRLYLLQGHISLSTLYENNFWCNRGPVL